MGKLFYFQTKCLCFGAGFFIDGKTEPKPHHTQYIVKFPCVHDPRGNDSVFNLQLSQTYSEQLFNTFSLKGSKARNTFPFFHTVDGDSSVQCLGPSSCV